MHALRGHHDGGPAMLNAHVQSANAQTARWVMWGLAAGLFATGFAKAFNAMGAVPATINGNAIAWPTPTWAMFGWLTLAVLGFVLFSYGQQIRGSVHPPEGQQ